MPIQVVQDIKYDTLAFHDKVWACEHTTVNVPSLEDFLLLKKTDQQFLEYLNEIIKSELLSITQELAVLWETQKSEQNQLDALKDYMTNHGFIQELRKLLHGERVKTINQILARTADFEKMAESEIAAFKSLDPNSSLEHMLLPLHQQLDKIIDENRQLKQMLSDMRTEKAKIEVDKSAVEDMKKKVEALVSSVEFMKRDIMGAEQRIDKKKLELKQLIERYEQDCKEPCSYLSKSDGH